MSLKEDPGSDSNVNMDAGNSSNARRSESGADLEHMHDSDSLGSDVVVGENCENLWLYRLYPRMADGVIRQIGGLIDAEDYFPSSFNTEAYMKAVSTFKAQEVPVFSREKIKHLADVFDAWQSASAEAAKANKATLTDLVGRTFEISCQVGQVATELDARVTLGSDTRHLSHTHQVIRGTPTVDYHLPARVPHLGICPARWMDYMALRVAYIPFLQNSQTKAILKSAPNGNARHWDLDELQQLFEKSVDSCQKCSPVFTTVKEILGNMKLEGVRKVVMFGGSTMEKTHMQAEVFNQHRLLLFVAECLLEANRHDIKIFAQDPVYGSRDKELLAANGITVLDDPRGLLEVDKTCIVIEMGTSIMAGVISDIARPAAMIWSCMTREGGLCTTARSLRMAEEYHVVDLPEDDKVMSFNLKMYVRKDLRQAQETDGARESNGQGHETNGTRESNGQGRETERAKESNGADLPVSID
ncbi:hypothetical protein QBC34DRAFT_497663 [Podospora aff. communis PSN243]|uniref:SRR1-like domain-containing protein n=1 Tax=Podospora aff. communis PSN243 TaxID=3040156 RepID=A0AAV9GC43_9PEZI|nr:hypothetical protein QBC34DRAFT_497663 [Podospora aff. communis PSN243]